MTTLEALSDVDAEAVEQLRAGFRGELVLPGDVDYDEARAVWNGMIDRRPALIARCAGVADVVAAVGFAREHGLLTAIRGGGHNVAGNAVCDGGIVVDVSPMKGVAVDPRRRTVHAQGGLTWGELDRETQVHGLATTGGLVSSTGIAGFTLGGGIGWLQRAHGLACDNLVSAEVVTAEGTVVRASDDEHPDLYFGLRGGGGNFGVVTSFEFRLHPVGPVLGGNVLYPLDAARDVLIGWSDFASTAPDELTTMAAFITVPPLPFIPEHLHGTQAVAIAFCYLGPEAEGQRLVAPLAELAPGGVALVHAMPYTVLQTMFDPAAPAGKLNYWKSEYLSGLTEEAAEALVDGVRRIGSPLTQVHVHQLGGAMSRVPEGETAFAHRSAPFLLNVIGMWEDPGESELHIAWARELWESMQPFSAGGAYVNFLGEEGGDRVRAAYDERTFERLAAVKQAYDPENFFRLNQNIRPAA